MTRTSVHPDGNPERKISKPLEPTNSVATRYDVSVIVPAYNSATYLSEAIGSIRAQMIDKNVQIVVVDDGSTDGSRSVLAELEGPDLTWFTIPNSGSAFARNAALENAEGEYIAFLDADDRWLPNKLERQLAFLEAEPDVGLVFSDFRRFDGNGYFPASHFSFLPGLDSLPSRAARVEGGRVLTGDAFIDLLSLSIFPTWLQTCLFRRSAIGDIRFDPALREAEDVTFMTRVYAQANVGFTYDAFAELRRHGSNKTGDHYEAELNYVYSLLAVKRRGDLSVPRIRALDHGLGAAWTGAGYIALHEGRYLESLANISRALRYPGSRLRALKYLVAAPALPLVRRLRHIETDWR